MLNPDASNILENASSERIYCRVVSFNIRTSTAMDGRHAWPLRREAVAQEIRLLRPDVFGLQEVTHEQMRELKPLLPEYEFVGVGRDDGVTEGEYSPACYLRERFRLIDRGWFWLSDTPEEAGSWGWDAACIRIATWLILADRASGREFFFLNTHIDHEGREAMARSSCLILKQAAELSGGRPVIVTGDFNAVPGDLSIRIMTGDVGAAEALADTYGSESSDRGNTPTGLSDTRMTAQEALVSPGFTFHNFRLPELLQDPSRDPWAQVIDFIFTSPEIGCRLYAVSADMAGDLCISDHLPVITDLII